MGNTPSTLPVRVLVADDEENQRVGLSKMIQSWGFTVDTAFDGQDAFDQLAQTPTHVLVTDLMMPRMDGFELLKRLGAQNTLPPTIVLTAFGNIETAVQTMHDLGAFWFLEKPIQPSALKVLLREPPRRADWRKKRSTCSGSCRIRACWWIWWEPVQPCSRFFH